jgi:integral membrane protein (TIGR01906 family)
MTLPTLSPGMQRALSLLATILVPIVLVLSGVRLMFFPFYRQIEYRLPTFPADSYGFTLEDRLYWSNFAVDYLLNDAGIEYLGDLRFADGTLVFNERELKHMVDVKVTVQIALRVWLIALGLLLAAGVWAYFGGGWSAYLAGLQAGGKLTLGLLGALLLFVIFGFGVFFVFFHNLFFQPGTWMFLWSDTLIRLFPEKFWQDIFIWVAVMASAAALALTVGLRPR